jgi:phosphoglycolate phosphatase-like HAD superfamily hydrolase
MDRTFQQLYGVGEAFAGMEFAGRTDGAILRDCYLRHALHAEHELAAEFSRFQSLYFEELARTLAEDGGCEVLPGVLPLLTALGARDDVVLGLGTGNYRVAAELKLRHVDLWGRFAGGGFADDSDHRPALIAAGLRRLSAPLGNGPVLAWVVGDSPHDVTAAKANGLGVVAVATGLASAADLLVAGADAVLPDLTDLDAFVACTLS